MIEVDIKEFSPVYENTPLKPGSGILLAFKLTLLALQHLPKKDMPLIIVSGEAADIAKNLSGEFLPAEYPASAARAAALFSPVMAFADTQSTHISMPSLIEVSNTIPKTQSNLLYIHHTKKESSFAHMFSSQYTATASIAYPEDYIGKIRKALEMPNFKYIEIYSPDPSSGFDPSNTVEVARLATECGIWPVYEYENTTLTPTRRPVRLEPLERYIALHKNMTITEEQIAAWQTKLNQRWKALLEGKLVA